MTTTDDNATSEIATNPGRKVSLKELQEDMEKRAPAFQAMLPRHIPVERFLRVVMTAIQLNPKLALVERRSLFTECSKAANDGLLPDGREGALVPHNDKRRGMIAVWMPMVAGLRKKVRQSGEIVTWEAEVVHERDQFDFMKGDSPQIMHKPFLGDAGKVIAAYSIAVLKHGEKSREVMSIAQINAIRARAHAAQDGPWVTDFEEMCRKTVAKRHSKVLPMSTDLDDLIRRDDALYDFEGAKDAAVAAPRGRLSLEDKLKALAGQDGAPKDNRFYRQPPDAIKEEEADEHEAAAAQPRPRRGRPPKRPEATGVNDPPLTDDERLAALLQQGGSAAEAGEHALQTWWWQLDALDAELVKPHLEMLRAQIPESEPDEAANVDL